MKMIRNMKKEEGQTNQEQMAKGVGEEDHVVSTWKTLLSTWIPA